MSSSTYEVARSYSTIGRRTPNRTHSGSAQDYPSSAKPTEGDVSLPYWSSHSSRRLGNSTSRYCNDDNTKCGTLYNFGLLYKDGEVAGVVKNLSGSSYDIDMHWVDRFTNDTSELTIRNSRGTFSRTNLTEGDFSLSKEDDGWAVPNVDSRGRPDDDGSRRAPTTVTAQVRGKDDFAAMDTLYVYDAGASSDDGARSARASGRIHGTTAANFDSAVSWSGFWTRRTGTETTSNTTSLGTISWKSQSVRLSFSRGRGATYTLKNGSTDCTGTTCTLTYNRTGSTNKGQAKENTLKLMVTAANGYDDHEYSLRVSRAAPVGNEMAAADFLRVDKVNGEDVETPANDDAGDGKSVSDAYTLETKGPSGSSLTMRIDLEMLGVAGESNAYCAQSAMVQEYNDTDTVKSLNPEVEEGENDPYEDDVCRDTRYRLRVPEVYQIQIKSEDGVAGMYYLNTRNRDEGGDARLSSLEVDDDAVTLRHPPNRTDTAFMNVVEVPDTVTIEWETDDANAAVTVSPGDTDSDEDGHQFALGDPDSVKTLTIRVVAENKEDTAHYGLRVQRANDVATLASLSADVDLNETFDSETTSYTADAAHDDAEVVFTYAQTDTDGSTNPTSPYTATLGAEGSTTTVSIVSTAEDGSTSMTYTVAVTRGTAPPDPTAGVVLMEDDAPFAEEMTEGETDTIEVTLATEPTADSSVTVTITATTGLTVDEGGTLTFTSTDWETAQNLIVTAATDDDAEPNDADLQFTFAGDTLTGYHGGLGDTITVAFMETNTKGVNLNATAKEVNEAVASTYTVVLNSQPVGGNVNIEISGVPDDVTMSSTQLEFTGGSWSSPQTVTITPTNDTDTASHSAFDLSHTVLGGGYTGMDVDDVTIQVLDDEAAQVVITTTALTVNENVAFTYTIALTDAPSAGETVTVDLSYSTGDFTGTTTVALTSSNYEAGETVTLTARNVDADAVKTISYSVSVADTDDSDDQVYDGTETATSTTVSVKNVPE